MRKLQQSGQALRVAKQAESSAKENLRVSTGRDRFQAVVIGWYFSRKHRWLRQLTNTKAPD